MAAGAPGEAEAIPADERVCGAKAGEAEGGLNEHHRALGRSDNGTSLMAC